MTYETNGGLTRRVRTWPKSYDCILAYKDTFVFVKPPAVDLKFLHASAMATYTIFRDTLTHVPLLEPRSLILTANLGVP